MVIIMTQLLTSQKERGKNRSFLYPTNNLIGAKKKEICSCSLKRIFFDWLAGWPDSLLARV